MSMNIKNEEAHELAKELAMLTGESVTSVVTKALREMKARLSKDKPESLSEKLLAIGKKCSDELKSSGGKILSDDDLYDENGLPF